jgi:hypothetical protein
VQGYIDIDKDDQTASRDAILRCQQSANAYFNYAEEFVGNSDLLGAHDSALWVQGFAEDCAEILKSMPDYFTFLSRAFSKLGNAVSRETLLPSGTAYANMQRMVTRYLISAERKALKKKLEEAGLPVYGFSNAARNAMSRTASSTGPSMLEKILAFAFGLVFVIVLLVMALAVPHPSEFQVFVFG